MSSATCFNLDQSKILSPGNVKPTTHIDKEAVPFIQFNPFPNDKF